MATGDRIPLVSGQKFEQLEQKVTADDTGLIPRVIKLENEGGGGVKLHDNTKAYKKDEIVIKDDYFYQALVDNTGNFTTNNWKKLHTVKEYDPIKMRQFLTEGASGDLVAKVEGNKLVVEMLNQQVGSETRVKRTFYFDGDTGLFRMENADYTTEPQDNDVVTLGYMNGLFVKNNYEPYNENNPNLNNLLQVGRKRIRIPFINGPLGVSANHTGITTAHLETTILDDDAGAVKYAIQKLTLFSPFEIFERAVLLNSSGSYETTQEDPVWVKQPVSEDILVNKDNFEWDEEKNRLTQKEKPTEAASDPKHVLTLYDAAQLFTTDERIKLGDEVDLNNILESGKFWGNNVLVIGGPSNFPTLCDIYGLDVEKIVIENVTTKYKQTIFAFDRDSDTDHVGTWERVIELSDVTLEHTFTKWFKIVKVYQDIDNGIVLSSDGSGGLQSTGVPYSRLGVLNGATNNSGAEVVDTDQFIHNDNGIMRQTVFVNIFNWLVTKLDGAISSYLTSNATANRAVVSHSSGKLGVSSVTTTELSKLSGVNENVQKQITDGWFARTSDVDLSGNKMFTDVIPVATSSGTITPSMVPWTMPTTEEGRRFQFAYTLNRLAGIIGTMDNDSYYDGMFSALLSTAASNASFMKTAWPTLGTIDVDQGALATAPASTELFKLIIGRDASYIYWVNVVGYVENGYSRGIKYETANNVYTSATSGAYPLIRLASSLVAGSSAYNNNLIDASKPALCLIPLRLQLY